MSTPNPVDISPVDQIIGHLIDVLKAGKLNTFGVQWQNFQHPDPEYFPTGPAGWIYPVRDEFPQGDVANGFNSELFITMELFLPEAGGALKRFRAIRTLVWNVRQILANQISIKPKNFPGTWESIRATRIDYTVFNAGQRLMERAEIEIVAKFRVVIETA